MSARVLVVDDDTDLCAELARALTKRSHVVVTAADAEDAFRRVLEEDFDCVVTDINMRGSNGIELCERIVQHRRDLPVIVITGFGSLDLAIATIRAGAFDFLTKPFGVDELSLALERALRHRALLAEVKRLQREVEKTRPLPEFVGDSTVMRAVYDVIHRVADTEASVLVTGESGSGKEVVARAIHAQSSRAKGPLVTVNCAAIPEGLLESELFGHTKGAFTDAKVAKRGLFLEASGGTLFLDELGELPLPMQAKLLRAIETRSVRPVGGHEELSFDARLIAATNRDLESWVQEGRFREDLFYRVNVVHIELPPLRSRGHDILHLAQTFIERMATKHKKSVRGMSVGAAEKLLAYGWPGNVRELQNCIERAVTLGRYEELAVEDLPPRVRDHKPSVLSFSTDDPEELVTLEELEKRYIERVMHAVAGSKTEATRVLGVDRSTLYRKLERYKIRTPESAK